MNKEEPRVAPLDCSIDLNQVKVNKEVSADDEKMVTRCLSLKLSVSVARYRRNYRVIWSSKHRQ